jgi:hypothetical protein
MEIYFKKLAHRLRMCDKLKIWSRLSDWRLREEMQYESKGCQLAEFLLGWERLVFVLKRLSTDWRRPHLCHGG